jgi:hypothetical protein
VTRSPHGNPRQRKSPAARSRPKGAPRATRARQRVSERGPPPAGCARSGAGRAFGPPCRSEVLKYKVVETSNVCDEELERILNEWTAQGWKLDTMQFAMRESSRRPAMAFISFTREEAGD